MADKNVASATFKYLFDQNRPYSATDIHMNLHKEFGKTAIQKALDMLVEVSPRIKAVAFKSCIFDTGYKSVFPTGVKYVCSCSKYSDVYCA